MVLFRIIRRLRDTRNKLNTIRVGSSSIKNKRHHEESIKLLD